MILNLQTSTFSIYGGIPTYNRLICRVLNDFDEIGEKHVLLAKDKPIDVEPQSAKLPNLKLKSYDKNRQTFLRRIVSLAVNYRIDLALIGHVNYAPIGLLLKKMQPEMRYGVIIYGIDVWKKLTAFRRRALQQADFIISISEYTKQEAVKANGVHPDRVHLLPNALEWDAEEDIAESSYPLLPAGTRLLTVCRLDDTEKYKGVDTVIEALPAVIAQIPDAQFLIVGDGSDASRLKDLAARRGVNDRVHFLGFVNDEALRACYRSCDVFVMPSAKEGFGFVFLEAMQYSKPVVAADRGGSPEVVLDGTTGILVKYGEIAQLERALIDLCLDPKYRERLGSAGYRRLQAHFTYPRFESTLTQILMHELPVASIYNNRCRALAKV
jgi:phosphatidylinositol alpha-1,6-mannosyltransferase